MVSKIMKRKSYKIVKLEKNRSSILTNDLDHCIICGSNNTSLHEVYFGTANRVLSMKYKLVAPLCVRYHHNQVACKGVHFDKELDLYLKVMAQKKAMEYYSWSKEEFIKIFGRSYI